MARRFNVKAVAPSPVVPGELYSPVNVGALFGTNAESNQLPDDELVFECSGGGAIILNLPQISTLPVGAYAQKVGVCVRDAGTTVNITPNATDTLGCAGTGVLVALASQFSWRRAQPISDNEWSIFGNNC